MYVANMTQAQFAALVQEKVNEAVINALTNKDLLNKAFEQPKKKYSTVKEVCNHFNISKMTLYNWEKKGAVKKHKFGGRTAFIIEDIEKDLTAKDYAFNRATAYIRI